MQDRSKLETGFGRINLGVALSSILALSGVLAAPAEARHSRHHHHASQRHAMGAHFSHRRHHEHGVDGTLQSRIAEIVVDANSGRILYARNENELRHPASITKVMTLYMLFEQIERGRLRLDSELRVSAHAAAQAPTKLGLRPGQTISVDDAIKAVVTRSANDIAVAIAETIGGDEDSFVDMMTRKAHSLGMSRTHFANASGLPNDAQVTTASDLAVLGRAIQDRFPRYYRYFSTHAFYYAGATILNHNHLMDRIEGMDGIKTGYTRASGFNLLTSVKRNGHFIVAVVLGGSSASSRDKIMADLIEDQIDNGETVRTAALISENNVRTADADEAQQDLPHRPEPSMDLPAKAPAAPKTAIPSQFLDPVRVASISPEIPLEKARPAYVAGALKPPAEGGAGAKPALAKQASLNGSTAGFTRSFGAAESGATNAAAQRTTPSAKAHDAEKPAASKIDPPQSAKVKLADAGRPAAARNGWMIQIGATDNAAKATELLVRAKSEGRKALNGAQPFTEKVEKGSGTLYRARFAGLEADSAELACKTLKRSGFACFATRN
ncbi:serine hydrolase [Methylocapsa palsarum]|uniref:D-alanyl-D-alanine carboxypeptidase n=1 Tax=Methylocapsa palsarum TaxID=1612308 RepID=A0A1I3WS20_9HYPH|nr:serine hydrolase [Methylocapsa palsarum]SFK09266.1 D-alanyl-D-alanine carboxypeptidase [Methylocapsa palsarum]